MPNRDSHPDITTKILNNLFTEEFIGKVSTQMPENICSESDKENKLKIAVTTILMKNIGGWIKEEGKLSINPCITTELALPSDIEMCPKWRPPGTYRNQTQTFNWICGRMQSTDIQTRTFLPPTDIVISATGWFPDPIFSYSLMLGIELKVINSGTEADEELADDIDKAIHFLNWQQNYYKQIQIPNTKTYSDVYSHIPGADNNNNQPKKIKMFPFFLIVYKCNSDENINVIITNICKEKINYQFIPQNGNNICFVRLHLKDEVDG